MRRLFFSLACCLMLAGCGGEIDLNDHSGLQPPPGWAPHPDQGETR